MPEWIYLLVSVVEGWEFHAGVVVSDPFAHWNCDFFATRRMVQFYRLIGRAVLLNVVEIYLKNPRMGGEDESATTESSQNATNLVVCETQKATGEVGWARSRRI